MIRGTWDHAAVGLTLVASLLPVIAALVFDQGADVVPRMVIAALVVAGWQVVFRVASGVAFAPAGAVIAVAVGALAPQEAPLWQIMIAVSFGTVIGELVFGGWGRNMLSAGVVTLAFLSLSLPSAQFVPPGDLVAWACLPGAVILLATGILPLAVVLAASGAFAAAAYGLGLETVPCAPLAFALVWLVADPVASAATPLGRWIYGALAGALAAVLLAGPADAAKAVVFGALLAQIFAPLIDQGVIALAQARRKARHG